MKRNCALAVYDRAVMCAMAWLHTSVQFRLVDCFSIEVRSSVSAVRTAQPGSMNPHHLHPARSPAVNTYIYSIHIENIVFAYTLCVYTYTHTQGHLHTTPTYQISFQLSRGPTSIVSLARSPRALRAISKLMRKPACFQALARGTYGSIFFAKAAKVLWIALCGKSRESPEAGEKQSSLDMCDVLQFILCMQLFGTIQNLTSKTGKLIMTLTLKLIRNP